jgi:hypothetical protein
MSIYYTHFHSAPTLRPPFPCTLHEPDQERLQQLLSQDLFNTYMRAHNFALRLRKQGHPNHRNKVCADDIHWVLEAL